MTTRQEPCGCFFIDDGSMKIDHYCRMHSYTPWKNFDFPFPKTTFVPPIDNTMAAPSSYVAFIPVTQYAFVQAKDLVIEDFRPVNQGNPERYIDFRT